MTYWLLLLALSGGLLYAFRRPVLRAPGRWLVVDDHRGSRDVIVLLNGGISTRPYRAAALYESSPAPVVMARLADTREVRLGVIPNVSDATARLLARLGVLESDVTVLASDRWVAGTWAEAVLVCAHIRERGYRRATLVTDAFHTRRARWTFRRVMGDAGVEFFSAPTPYSLGLVDRWWRSEYGLVHVLNEYIKFAYYRHMARTARRPLPAVESDLPPAEETRELITDYSGQPGTADGNR